MSKWSGLFKKGKPVDKPPGSPLPSRYCIIPGDSILLYSKEGPEIVITTDSPCTLTIEERKHAVQE